MIEKEQFKKPFNIDISVSTIGINKDDWFCHKQGMKKQAIRDTMLRNGFDVVPIANRSGIFKDYFSFKDKNRSSLVINKIESEDKLYYLTHVRDAIWKMKANNRTHYFLTNGRNDNEVVGLLSLSNFNCREFYVYVFSLLSNIERAFAQLIKSDFEAGFSKLDNYTHTSELKAQLDIIKERFYEDKAKNMDNDYKEYLYLHHIIWLVKEEGSYKSLNYTKYQDFEAGTGNLKDLRNSIAHPVKSLVRNLNDLHSLDRSLNKLYEFQERLEAYLKTKTY